MNVQSDPNQNLLIQMAITLKIHMSDPMLVKPKCVSEVCIYFQLFVYNFQTHSGLYKHRARNAYFQSYSHLNWQILICVTLYKCLASTFSSSSSSQNCIFLIFCKVILQRNTPQHGHKTF